MKSLKKQIWSSFGVGLDLICTHAMEMDKFFFPFPLSWCRSCNIL